MPYSHRSRTERQIAIARVLMAFFALTAVWLDPAERAHYPGSAYVLMAVYVAYALVVLLLVTRISMGLEQMRIVTHGIDIAVFSAIIYLTEGPTSLFFVLFVFTLITATMRWQGRGALVTAVVTLVAFFVLSLLGAYVHHYREPDVAEFVIGIVYLAVVGWLLSFLGLYETQLRNEMGRLAVWSRDEPPDYPREDARSRMLAHAAEAMGAPRLVFTWEDREDPWLNIALVGERDTVLSRAAPDEFSPLVASDLEEVAFLCPNVRGGPGVLTIYGTDRDLGRRCGAPVNRAFADRFEMRSVVSVPVGLDESVARLFFLDKPRLASDDLTLAAVIATAVGLLMAESHLQDRLREAAAFEERVSLARDLHDGVLQSLTGTALQLATAGRLLESDVPAAQGVIETIQRSLTIEQRDLRLFVDQLKPGHEMLEEAAPDLRIRFLELRENISSRWKLDVEMVFEDRSAPSSGSDGLAQDVYFIVSEGLVNSARHARATRARATVRQMTDRFEIQLEDDGIGFRFQGRHDAASLRGLRAGPVALMQRVEARGGTLVVDSSLEGSCIEITLPFDALDTTSREAPHPRGAP